MPDPSTVLPIELLQKIFKHYLLDWPNADVAAPLFNNPTINFQPLKQQPLFENRQTLRYLTPGPVQSLDLSYGLWVLGKVNRAWRNATLSSETLWSTVRITFSSQPQWFQDLVWDRAIRKISFSPDSNIPSKILTEILSRSGSAPLSITLSLPVEMPREEILADAVSRSLFVLLSEQSHRWQWMELTVPTMIWEDFVQISPSRLETLRRLHATVQGGPFLFQIIGVCTSVVDLKISVTHWKSHTALPPIPIMMPFLQYLDIGSSQCDVLKAITAPSLKSLRLQTRDTKVVCHRSVQASWTSFSGRAVQTLWLHWIYLVGPAAVVKLSKFSHARHRVIHPAPHYYQIWVHCCSTACLLWGGQTSTSFLTWLSLGSLGG
ncbi:hypothetical protein IW261DRAFT_737006 [Armillaria novae-zelandiae]|uniref:F-box domain-containing protein n=1 Tax=Armillaria novae-zelandiae TaxID=153914 RepID=A0AA39NVI1_9AGAR|nr:hypothetical protein IW261DRAFT_737006 [Armillaria novae-zelandiae]